MKYEWDSKYNTLVLDRVLHSAVFYPHNYGFIPETLCDDGDHLDVLVLSDGPMIPGSSVVVRPICYMIMEDEKGMDEKVLAVIHGGIISAIMAMATGSTPLAFFGSSNGSISRVILESSKITLRTYNSCEHL